MQKIKQPGKLKNFGSMTLKLNIVKKSLIKTRTHCSEDCVGPIASIAVNKKGLRTPKK